MTADFNSDTILIENFDASAQMKLFLTLKQNRFSGQLCFKNLQNLEWVFFIYLGRIIYATGGKHSVRRWRRNLTSYMPQIARQLQQELQAIDLENSGDILLTWDYHLLNLWVTKKKVDLEQVTKNIRALTSEILFDFNQANTVSFHLIEQHQQSFQPLAMIDSEQQINHSEKLWQKWQDLNFEKISPDLAPKIIDLPKLQANTSEKTYRVLTRLLDGKHSIRDLAVQKQSDELTFLRSILPYMQLGTVDFVEIPDIPYPIAIPETSVKQQSDTKATTGDRKLLIACVALSHVMSQVMAKVATVAGYEFMGQVDPMEAMPLLLDSKPDIIFLDIELPGLSGYEMCTQLRQLDYFSKTPIILFGRNITLIERMKSKMSGSSELFQQSMDMKFILDLIQKYAKPLVRETSP